MMSFVFTLVVLAVSWLTGCASSRNGPEAVVATPIPPRSVTIPEYRWVVDERRVILRASDLGLKEGAGISPEGLTFAKNGDLLMAACCSGAAKTFIVRSSDAGKTWKQHGVLNHKGTDGYPPNRGTVEGLLRTRSGRLVLVYYILRQGMEETEPGDPYYVPYGASSRFTHMSSAQWGAYSDDEGKTWQYVPMDIAPFQSMDAEASSQIFETGDGTLVASFRGHLNQQELDAGLASVGIIRSHDGGESWGDASILHRGEPGSGRWFNESQVVPLADGRWVCMLRLNDSNQHHKAPIIMHRLYSTDEGRTWSYPVQTQFRGGEPGLGLLPDGALLATQTGGWMIDQILREDETLVRKFGAERHRKLLYEVSYDGALTWAYWGDLYLSGANVREHIGSPIVRALDNDTAIVVHHRGSKPPPETPLRAGPQVIGASWLHKRPADSAEARRLRSPQD